MALMKDGTLASSSGNGNGIDCSVRIWDTKSGQLVKTFNYTSGITNWRLSLAVLRDGSLVSGSRNNNISIC